MSWNLLTGADALAAHGRAMRNAKAAVAALSLDETAQDEPRLTHKLKQARDRLTAALRSVEKLLNGEDVALARRVIREAEDAAESLHA